MGKLWCGARETTAEAIRERAQRAASGLESLGVREGDAVAFCLRNEFAFFEVVQGAGILGAFPVAVNWHCTLDEADYVLRDCGAGVLVIHADLLANLRPAIPEGVRIVSVRTPPEVCAAYGLAPSAGEVAPGDLEWGAWLEGFPPWSGEARRAPSVIIYTSGTTGRPKG
ncbi:MAG: AMP-binding protein, partial [Phenylobacterium sp.]|nr:AMP-binding protein [Phenylobacterium sp.]